ncbi:type I Iterative Polyketide synthase (PKS) [Aspergillus brasiliensis]|uniref:Type I Iterative Polyketide synthase (PKS) n=1 Tax=Aspergillus brasiliensis TaxID=319629 RepID=A0A9W5Z1U9_9EURO|nr:type I Iterative Polyketide synthase (PKS) [Aspergillus brasiliensis]GKZ50516.1 type I Iterative Polyketide synthase (PKS) [Aspergillus brasiliensis]
MTRTEPIAIIGTGCRFPGSASSPSRLWELLENPRDVASKAPPDRFNADAFYQPGKVRPGMMTAPESYFLQEDIRTFDAPFFKVSPSEAASMDPQQRLLMEVVYESLERAGLPLQNLQGSSTGVYCGSMSNDYLSLLGADIDGLRPFSVTGTTASILANRISYFFDWRGPSFVLDTACSSSLVALHLAAEALQNDDCSLAVVVGSNLILSPNPYVWESQMQMLSPTGRCRMWDAHADGYARGEGVAALVLKRLQDAVADGDPIECVIRSTGINSDGRTEALTLPNGEAQRDLIRSTYARAGLNPLRREDRCQFFEAHGTGTLAGDPQEAFGISSAFFDEASRPDDMLYVGSIKSVAGHAEGTAGIAGVLKASLAIQHGVIPPNLLFNELSPLVAPYTSHLQVPTKARPWPDLPSGTPRRVSVNSFGFGGANAHVILESFSGAPSSSSTCEVVSPEILPFVFSAASEASLTALLRLYIGYLEEHPTVNLLELAASLLKKRSTLSHRLILTAGTIESLREALNSEVQRRSTDTSSTITRRLTPGPKKILGVFTGQGAQWPQMGLDVISQSPQARIWMKELQQALDTLPAEYKPTFTLLDELSAPEATSRLNSAAISLPLRTALQIIQVNILRSLGIEFAAVVGHSSGEIGAAYAAGWLTLTDAIRIAYLRGVAAQHAGSQGKSGAMLAVSAPWDQADAMRSEAAYSGTIVIAAFNSPNSVTFSGDSDLITELEWVIESLGYSARRLRVDTAYHSDHMIPCADPYVQSMKQCQIQTRRGLTGTKWFSSVFEDQVMQNLDIQYWSDNMLRPVLFSQALTAAVKDLPELDAIVEVGPHAALQGPTMQTLSAIKPDEADIPYIGMANRKTGGIEALSLAVGSFWASLGAQTLDILSYTRLFSPSTNLSYLTDLPTYPFDHSQRYWAVPRLSSARINRQHAIHPLLGAITPETGEAEWRWRNFLRVQDLEWMDGHQVQSQIVFPATGYLVMALEAARIVANERVLQLVEIHELTIDRAITIPDNPTGVETLFTFYQTASTGHKITGMFTCQSSFETDTFSCCASGRLEITFGEPEATLLPPMDPTISELRSVNSEDFYQKLAELGYGYSGIFRTLQDIRRQKDIAIAKLPTVDVGSAFLIHPATLDTGLQAMMAAIGDPNDGQVSGLYLPTRIASTTFNPSSPSIGGGQASHGPYEVAATLSWADSSGPRGDIDLFDKEGRGVVQIEGVEITPLARPTIDDIKIFGERTWGPWLPNAALSGPLDLPGSALHLHRLALQYLRNTQQQLTPEDRQQLDWHRGRYVAWMDRMLDRVRSGDHPSYPSQWLESDDTSFLTPEFRHVVRYQIACLERAGPKLIEWLRGQASIMEELRRDDLLTRFYQDQAFREMTCSLADVVSQLAFRFPRMKILEVGAGTGSATREVLDRIGRDYHSYTYTDISAAFFEAAESTFVANKDRFIYQVLNLEQDPTEQGFTEHAYDLIIASNVLHATSSLSKTMTHVRRLLKPGGRVVVMELSDAEDVAVSTIFGGFEGWWLGEKDGRPWGPMVSIDTWDQVLRNAGFGGLETVSSPKIREQMGLSVFSAQAVDDHISKLQQPLSVPATGQYSDLILLGGASALTERLVKGVRDLVAPFFTRISHSVTLEDFVPPPNSSLVSVLVLSDIDTPCLQEMSADRLRNLQSLFEASGKLLWVATGKPGEEPYQAMTKGILRCLAYEMPHALLQHLTISEPDTVDPSILATTLMRLVHTSAYNDYSLTDCTENPEWELRLEDGMVMIPRVKASPTMNRRLLTSRGYPSREHVEPKLTPVNIVPDTTELALVSLPQRTLPKQTPDARDHDIVYIRVHYATLSTVYVESVGFAYLVLGQDQKTRTRVVGLSVKHASVVSTPASWCWDAPSWLPEKHEAAYLSEVATALIARHLVNKAPSNTVLLVDEAAASLQESVAAMASIKGVRVRFTTSTEVARQSQTTLVIPPRSSSRAISRLLPAGVSVFASLRSETDSTVARIKSSLSPAVTVYGLHTLYGGLPVSRPEGDMDFCRDILAKSCLFAEQQAGLQSTIVTINPSDVSVHSLGSDYSIIVDWLHSGPVSAYPLSASSLVNLNAHKTYLLVGMTGDIGRSVCEWMISRGARYLVLTSRNPSINPRWIAEMSSLGAHVVVKAMDVSDRTSVLRVHNYMLAELPPVGGVVNGAMVLRDVAFAEASLEDVTTVLGPKVKGSQILNELYQDEDLDFFILMGSYAGVGGNFHQSIYAATSVFMEDLVLQRRLRGQVGSIVCPAEVRGIGYVARMGSQTIDHLAKTTGKLILSERDLLEQFAEAILAGRPDSGRDPSIICGLALTDPAEYPDVIWYKNPSLWSYVQYSRQSEVREGKQEQIPIKTQLQSASSLTEAAEIIALGFSKKLERKLQLPPDSDLPGTTLLSDFGIDSLIAVDLRVWFVKEIGVDMPVLKLLGGLSIDALARDAAGQLDPVLLPKVQA